MESIVSENIKRLRESNGFTQDMVASFLSIKRSAYSNYESGLREPPVDVMERIADLYGCDTYDLYSRDESVLNGLFATAFRVDSLSSADLEQIAAFKRIVRASLRMDKMLER